MAAETTETAKGMVDAAEAAPRLRVSARTVRRAVDKGLIPGLRIGSLVRVNAAWLDEVTTWPQEVTP